LHLWSVVKKGCGRPQDHTEMMVILFFLHHPSVCPFPPSGDNGMEERDTTWTEVLRFLSNMNDISVSYSEKKDILLSNFHTRYLDHLWTDLKYQKA